jgi:hypothetical protein
LVFGLGLIMTFDTGKLSIGVDLRSMIFGHTGGVVGG